MTTGRGEQRGPGARANRSCSRPPEPELQPTLGVTGLRQTPPPSNLILPLSFLTLKSPTKDPIQARNLATRYTHARIKVPLPFSLSKL